MVVKRGVTSVQAKWTKLDEILVCTRSDFPTALPPVRLPDGYRIHTMDMHDECEIADWLTIHNDAYGRRWGPGRFHSAVMEHPHVHVLETFFVLERSEPVAAASVAVYRRNESVAVGHYLGALRRVQNRGLGKQLVIHRCHMMRDAGYRSHESETTIGRTRSLLIHFELGFRPKRLDHWNTPDTASMPGRALTDARLWGLYQRWRRSRR